MKKALLGLIGFILPLSLSAQLNKGYGQLEKGEYAEAKTNLLKNRNGSKPYSKDIVEAYFGLYGYYSTENNPESDADKAWLYLDSTSTNFKEDFKVKYKPYEGVKMSKPQIDSLKARMEARAYAKAAATNTVPAWKQYIAFYTKTNNTPLLIKAQAGLSHKAYEDCAKNNDLPCLEAFVVEYKTAKQADSALVLIDKLRWKNALTANTRDAFATFVKTFPTNSKFLEATDSLSAIDYRALAKATTASAYKAYLGVYPNSTFKNAALSRICLLAYDSVITANKEAAMRGYLIEYPGCPQVAVLKDKLERIECEKCLAAPTKECLALVMKNCGSDNVIAQRVTSALMAMVEQNKVTIECEKCLANPTKDCLIQLYKSCGADSGIVKRANSVFMTVINRERDKMISDSLARKNAAAALAAQQAATPPPAPAQTVEKAKSDTVKTSKPDSDEPEDELTPVDKLKK